jgi:cytochrome P450
MRITPDQLIWKTGQSSSPLPKWANRFQAPKASGALNGQDFTFFLDSYLTMGPIFRFARGNQEFTVMAGPEANLFISLEGADHLSAHAFRQDQDLEFDVQKNLVSMDGEEHAIFRKQQKRGYGASSLDHRYAELIATIQAIAREWSPGQSLRVNDTMPRLIAEQLGIGVLNYPVGDYLEDVLLFVRTVVAETVARVRPKNVIYSPAYLKAKQRSLELADKVIEAHRLPRQSDRTPDLVDDLLDACDRNEEFLTEQELRIAVLGGYIGGLDTVAYTCSYMLYALLKHPDIFARVLHEVDRAFDEGFTTAQALRGMKALRHAAMETLRMYPVAAAIVATVSKPFEFAGCRVDRGQNLIVATTVTHYLPEFYPDPNTFDIDRYSEPRNEHQQPGAFAPFGLGPHICLGAGMAEVLIMLTIATILRTLALEMDPPDYQLQLEFTPTPVPRDFRVRIIQRRNQN